MLFRSLHSSPRTLQNRRTHGKYLLPSSADETSSTPNPASAKHVSTICGTSRSRSNGGRYSSLNFLFGAIRNFRIVRQPDITDGFMLKLPLIFCIQADNSAWRIGQRVCLSFFHDCFIHGFNADRSPHRRNSSLFMPTTSNLRPNTCVVVRK